MTDIAKDAGIVKHDTGLSAVAMLGALGVVYGDIGTSPLYAFKEAAKSAGYATSHSPDAIFGVVSLILWALILIVSIKYALLILRADNHGEGGIVALLALLGARHGQGRVQTALLTIGLIGAALLYGDGAITPAISVLSAVEGLEIDAPGLTHYVVPITVVILLALFIVQKKGTGFVGTVFGPIMVVWFLAIGILGLRGILMSPGILLAINPWYALKFMATAGPMVTFAMLGAAFLAVTGGEAMYADMGHFGCTPIRGAWFGLVLPMLMLNYFGQGGLLLSDPSALDNPFYQLSPDWLHYPLVAFATAATVIASQSIISGAYSLSQQAIQLGFLPHLHILHTASLHRGQIYVPVVNWLLAIATIGAVITFGSSDALAGAYGIAVSLLMAITTFLAALIALKWGYSLWIVLIVNGLFLVIDLVFFGANSLKLFDGGWFPLALAIGVAFIMLTWRRGNMLVEAARAHLRKPESSLLEPLDGKTIIRLPGTAVFLSSSTEGIPTPLTVFKNHTHAIHEHLLIVTIMTEEAPFVDLATGVSVRQVCEGVSRVIMHFGFMNNPDVPRGLQAAIDQGLLDHDLKLDQVSYYLGRERIIANAAIEGMAVWRESLFSFIQANAERSAVYFRIPARQVVEMGSELEI